jgi:LBP / BPI / CETP family, C-terminal domain
VHCFLGLPLCSFLSSLQHPLWQRHRGRRPPRHERISVTADPDLRPHLDVTAATLNVGDFNVQFHGSAWDGLLKYVKPDIEKAVTSALDKDFPTAINKVVDDTINPRLADMPIVKPIDAKPPYNISEIRFGLVNNPTFTSTYVGFGIQGDIVLISDPVAGPIAPSDIPPFNSDAGSSYLQLQLSRFTAMTAAYAYYKAGVDNWLVPPAQIPFGFNDSSAYTLIAPGLLVTYPHNPVTLNVRLNDVPNVAITKAGLNMSAPIAIDWLITANNGSQVNAFTLLCDTDLGVMLSTGTDVDGNMALLIKLLYLNASISTLNTNVGKIETKMLQHLVDFVFTDIVVPVFNDIFQYGIPLPSFDGLTLTNSQIVFEQGFVTIGTDFTFDPSSVSKALIKQPARASKPIAMLEAPKKLRSKGNKRQH